MAACGPAKTVLEPTPTSLPTATSLPTSIPGFTKTSAPGIEIWFPAGWEGGDLKNDLEVTVSKLRALGPEFDQIAQMIETNQDAFVLWLFDSKVSDGGFLTNANLVKEQVLSAITLDTYMSSLKSQLPSYMVITDQKMVKVGQYDAARVEITMDISGTKAKELLYIFDHDHTMWTLTFATSEDEFSSRVPVFEQIASTFSVQP